MKKKILGLAMLSLMVLPKVVLAQFPLPPSPTDVMDILFGGSDSSSGGLAENSYGLPSGSIFGIVENILYWLLAIIGIVSIIGFLIAGILYLTSAGEETQITKAKSAMKFSIIGVIVGLSGFVVLRAAMYMLSGSSF